MTTEARFGYPDEWKIRTSFIERYNLTGSMQLWRYTWLTNAHSKSLDHHAATTPMFVAFYSFCRKHKSCGKGKQTPAMVAGLTDHIWMIRELLGAAA